MSGPDPAQAGPVDRPGSAVVSNFNSRTFADLRHAVRARAVRAGLVGDRLEDFIVAVHELATNAVRHGGGTGRLQLRQQGDILMCEVSDQGTGFADGLPAISSPPPDGVPGGRGLWLACQLSDTLLITDRPDGVTVAITVCLTSPGPPDITAPATEAGRVPTPRPKPAAEDDPPPPHCPAGRSAPT